MYFTRGVTRWRVTHPDPANMSDKPISPNPPRWKPNPDPANILIPGLDTEASTTDQIEQIEQLITIKLQVGFGFRLPNAICDKDFFLEHR
jgi:hypothetical protein